jgi:hypothetical protein
MTVTFINEVVHLFGDDVSGFADAMENTDVLKQRRDDLAIPRCRDRLGKCSHEPSPTGRFGREDVAHPRAGLELGHKYSG